MQQIQATESEAIMRMQTDTKPHTNLLTLKSLLSSTLIYFIEGDKVRVGGVCYPALGRGMASIDEAEWRAGHS